MPLPLLPLPQPAKEEGSNIPLKSAITFCFTVIHKPGKRFHDYKRPLALTMSNCQSLIQWFTLPPLLGSPSLIFEAAQGLRSPRRSSFEQIWKRKQGRTPKIICNREKLLPKESELCFEIYICCSLSLGKVE